jgi:hypothetical protein
MMGIEQTSADLTSRIIAMSEIEEDDSLSDADKAEKLKSMKLETLDKINAEIANVTVSSQKILDNIRTIVENENWAKLPPSKKLANEISLNNSVAIEMQSIVSKFTPDIQELMSFFIEVLKRSQLISSKAEINSMGQQWQAIHEQKVSSEEAAKAEKLSGIISGSFAIATALASIAVKATVMGVSAKKINESNLQGSGNEEYQAMLKKNDQVQGQIDDEKVLTADIETELKTQEVMLAKRKADPLDKKINETDGMRASEIKQREDSISRLKNKLQEKKSELDVQKIKASEASAQASSVTARIESENNKASRSIQEWRSMNEILDSVFSAVQQGGNIWKAENDLKAAGLKIDSDMSSFMVNFFSSMIQSTRKDGQDFTDLQKSMMSTIQASLQTNLSADSYAIRGSA